jgi:sucrose-6-phosphate hydrolase SacC (GH32 family)
MTVEPGVLLTGITGDLLEIHADIEIDDASSLGFIVCGQTISYIANEHRLSAIGGAPLTPADGHLRLTVLVDRTSIEIFADDGRVSLTSCFDPHEGDNSLSLFTRAETAHVKSLVVYELKSAWK